MTCTKHQPGILYYDICSPWKHRPLPLFGTYRYPVFIYILILTVSTSHRSIIFVDNIRHVYRNFLFLSIPSFWTKTIWCHSDCSIIFPNYSSLFLTLIGRIYNIKIPSVLLQNIFLAWNGNLFHAIYSQSTYNRDISERTLINQLKWVDKVINWK